MEYLIFLSLFATLGLGFPEINEYQRTPLGDSIDKASMKMLKESFQNAKDKNVITSPLGVLTLLSIFSSVTEGENREEIMQLLGSSNYKQIEESYGNLMSKFSSMDPGHFVLANKMYISDKYTLDNQFSDVASQSFKTEIEQVDFGQNNATVHSINKWADDKTKGHIKSPVNEEMIDEATVLALINVIFFQGHWDVPFNVNKTEEKEFYVSESENSKKRMMKLQHSLLYNEDSEIGAKMVELPYKENGFRMVVVLPDKKDGLAEVVDKLAQKGILDDVFKLIPAEQEIALEMPRFDIKTRLDLTEILPKVGVSRMFSEAVRGVVREQEVAVSKAFQEAFVKVNEEGASAGAFTGLLLENRSFYYVPPLEFKVDHPFMFVILHEDIVLFTGTYTH